jgi:hypothetical protein
MWYPLKNSLFALCVASTLLFVILTASRMSSPHPGAVLEAEQALTASEHALTQTIERVLPHLMIADAQERARVGAALQSAALLSARLQAGTVSDVRRAARWRKQRQSTMPFFSFGSLLDNAREAGA